MKKFISLAMALCLLVGSLAGVFVVNATGYDEGNTVMWENPTGLPYTAIITGTSYAVRFVANGSFDGIMLGIPDNCHTTCTVYAWNTDYATTTSSDKLYEATFEIDTATATGALGVQELAMNDRSTDIRPVYGYLPAGEYLMVVTAAGSQIAYVNSQFASHAAVRYYQNGVELSNADTNVPCIAGGIHYIDSSVTALGTVGGTVPTPEEKPVASDYSLNPQPNTWTAVDGLGREVEAVGSLKTDKYVGMFYWASSGYWGRYTTAYNITELLNKTDPSVVLAAKNDYNHSLWTTDESPSWFWDEPLFGYYTAKDNYVIRKHAEMLADAGVDFIVFDATSGLNRVAYINVFEVFSQAKKEGVDVPQIVFCLAMGDADANAVDLRTLYEQIYSQGLYQDLWFYYEGKPLILAYKDYLAASGTDGSIRNFFTYRRPDGVSWRQENMTSTANTPYWGWLNLAPYTKYYVGGDLEEMTVSVAQNIDYVEFEPTAMNGTNVAGRSWTYQDNYSYSYTKNGAEVVVNKNTQNAVLYGLNFQEQWDLVHAADPTFVFVTGWNEWTVGRSEIANGVTNAFVDQYNTEYSRDIEPSAGLLKDHYYYQLIDNIRRFKGVGTTSAQNTGAAIDIHGDVSQWDAIASYDHYLGSTWRRDSQGYGDLMYMSDTMRNDIIRAKVTCDDTYVYFYVRTAEALSPISDPAWMRLFLDTSDTAESWEGFEYVINRTNPMAETCSIERVTGVDGEGNWICEAVGVAEYSVKGDVLQLAVPRAALGLTDDLLSLNFKWSDNMQSDGDIYDFYQSGDVAPGGRFCFSYTNENSKSVGATPDTETTDIIYRGCQVSNNIQTAAKFNIRFAAVIDSLGYESTGFEVSELSFDRSWTSTTTTVYTSLNATASDGTALQPVTATQLGGNYIVAVTIKNVPTETALTFCIRPYVVTLDGNKEYGETWFVTVDEAGTVTNIRYGDMVLQPSENGSGDETEW